MGIFEVRESYIRERQKIWDKMQETNSQDEYESLVRRYEQINLSYQEFLLVNNLNDID